MNQPRNLLSILTIVTCLSFLSDSHPPSFTPHQRFAPAIRQGSGRASNWAGYVAATDLSKPLKHSVTDVRGSWRVPTVASSGALDTSSSVWVGIDGSSDNTVEQLGTEQDWSSGAPVYYAWFEMYPSPGYRLTTFPVQPGDEISAEVQFVEKNQFILSMSNLTQNAGFSITKKKSTKRTSAEWIAEAPFFHRILALADFGVATFAGCSANIDGVEGPINDVSWQDEPLTMANSATRITMAQPSILTGGGTGFSVEWRHN